MTTSYQLYSRHSAGSFAVQVALEQLGASYELIWISHSQDDVDKLRRIIPTGKVPALVLPDGTVLMESAAMLIHLAAVDRRNVLAPAPGTSEHALFLQWMVFLSANVYETALRMYYADRFTSQEGEAQIAAVRSKAEADFLTHLQILCDRLGPYLLGQRSSIADVYLYMLAGWWTQDKATMYARMPALQRHAALVAALPGVAKAEADHAG